MHPSTAPRVSTKSLLNLVEDWQSRAAAAEAVNDETVAGIWRVAAREIHVEIAAARANWIRATEARRPKASVDVENRAIARQLKDTAKSLYVQSADYFDQADQQLEAGKTLASQETRRAGEIAAERAERSEKALEILIEHTGLDPTEI